MKMVIASKGIEPEDFKIRTVTRSKYGNNIYGGFVC